MMQIPAILLAFVIASGAAQKWAEMPGAAVDISTKGKELWMINKDQQIHRWTGTDWQEIDGVAVRVCASPDGWTWVINKADQISRYNVVKKKWDRMPGSLMQISAVSKDKALGVNRDNNIYLWENNTWKQLPGSGTWVGIGDGDERWVVNSKQKIYRWNHQTKTWDHMPGSAVNVSVQSPCRVIMTNAANRMYIWKNNNWQLLTGAGTICTINYKHYFCVNKADEIWMSK